MAKPELGTKRVCPTTGRKFYDLNRDPIVSPYTGEVLPRAAFEPARGPVSRARPKEEDEEVELAPAGAETVSLEDVSAGEEAAAGADGDADEEVTIEEETTADDTFLEEEEEGGDVADLIDNVIEDEEEA